MTAKDEFIEGLFAYKDAHKVIFKYQLGSYLLVPGALSLVYASIYFFLAYQLGAKVGTDLTDLPNWLAWMGDFLYYALKFLYWSAAVLLFLASFKYVLQVILSPFLSLLSEAVEKRVLGMETGSFSWKEFFQDIRRSLIMAIRNSVIELVATIALGFIPAVGQILSFFVSSYYSGLGYMDYVLERKRMNVSESLAFCRKHRGLVLGIGTFCNLFMLVPVWGWIMMPSYATVAATLETLKILNGGLNPAADSAAADWQSARKDFENQ